MYDIRFRRFDPSLRTTFAQAKELALAQTEVPILTAGTLQTEEREGGRFVYRYRYDALGKRVTEYLGAESTDETREKVDAARAEIADKETLGRYSLDLRKLGFYGADNSTAVTVSALFNAGVFGGGAILIGTHAFGAILNELGVAASPFPFTEDIDVARADRLQIATLPRGGMLELLNQTGLRFCEVPALRRSQPATSYRVRGRKLSVDLLVPARGMPYQAVPVPELGTHATGLPQLRYLLEGASPSVLLARDRIVPIVVPNAGRFCVHKLAVYSLRGGGHSAKRDKDVRQAALLAAILVDGEDFLLREAIGEVSTLLRRHTKHGARRAIELLIEDDHPEAAEVLGKLA